MINWTICPLCPNGIGHQIDDQHAERINRLLSAVKSALMAHQKIEPHYVGDCDLCRVLGQSIEAENG
jgi:hypothetical protein